MVSSQYGAGSPRFVRHFNELVPNTYRIMVDGDVVTARAGLFYEHAGVEVLVDFGAHRTGLDLTSGGGSPG
mgnify:CR=1 FL=1